MKIGVVGFPGLYAGASVELDHQLTLWHRMGLEVHLVPTWDPSGEPLLSRTLRRATVHAPGEYEALAGMPVVSFCCDDFLSDLPRIREHATRVIWVNCMTWLFNAEREAHKAGLIDLFLYQSEHQLEAVRAELEGLHPSFRHQVFRSWFDVEEFPYHKDRPADRFRFGRISREDADKFAAWQLWVYDTMVAPVPKAGVILGYGPKTKKKIGDPPEWIRAYPGGGISQREFYAHSAAVIQACDTFENWPRVGLEAMASGSLLIVDDRGGWQRQVEHGVTGWLCRDQREFVYYASRAAFEPEERERMASVARAKLLDELVDTRASEDGWREAFAC